MLQRQLTAVCLTVLAALLNSMPALSQEALDLSRFDPVAYFTASGIRTWIGEARFMMTNYVDTVHASRTADGRSLLIQRTLVDADDAVVVSRAEGEVKAEPGDTTFFVHWKESRYPEATGRMRFVDNVWAVFFDGEWSKWSIHFQRQDHNSFQANVARSIGNFAPVPLAGMIYHAANEAGSKSQ
jgi:hypothetical protein